MKNLAALFALLAAFLAFTLRKWRRRRRVKVLGSGRDDALKHLFHCEYRNQTATPESLAGAAGIPLAEAVRLLEGLQRDRLARPEHRGVRLTGAGREKAARIVRAHRLIETRLARETGLRAEDWHGEAEIEEHELTATEVNALADRLGRPRFDPHGDPIPTRKGTMPPAEGITLLEWNPRVTARIVHVEDEPREIYEEIVASGLAPGMIVKILARTPAGVQLEREGRALNLSTAAGGNVMVVAAPAAAELEPDLERLSVLAPGEAGVIRGLSPACHGAERNRLLDLGLVPGTNIARDMTSALGSPTAYRVRGTLVALRTEQADRVLIEVAKLGKATE